MAFYLGSSRVYPGIIPTPNATNNGAMLFNDGARAYWSYPGEAHATVGTGWRYRTILTHGYIAAGYKGYNPWRSVNKTWHQTDTTVYCGEQIDKAAAYLDGTWSDFNAYVHGTSDTWQGSSAHTSSYNLYNGSLRMQNDTNFTFFGSSGSPYGYEGNNPNSDGFTYGSGQSSPATTGGWNMSVTRVAHGCASTQGSNGGLPGGAGYVFGGGSTNTDKLNFHTEIMYTTTTSPVTWGTTAGVGGQNNAYILGSSSTAYNYYMSWSSDTFTSWSAYSAYFTSDGNNKSLMSKYGWAYISAGTNTVSTIAKMNDTNQTYMATLTKLGGFGEENQQMGQDWGYMLGMYNGQQNNWAVKTTYSTDAMVTMGFATQPKGHYGTSSGCCSSAAASVCSVQRA
jgi:hypothetical protein